MSLIRKLKSAYSRWKLRRQAHKALRALFFRPDLQEISSLRRDHLPRASLLDFETEGQKVVRLRFGIIRHPQPIRVPQVHDEVIEIYSYDLSTGKLDLVDSYNLTRRGRPG